MNELQALKTKWIELGGSVFFWDANVKTVEHAKAYLKYAFGPNSLRNN